MNTKTAFLCMDCDEVFEPNYPLPDYCPACAGRQVRALSTFFPPFEENYRYAKRLEDNYRYFKEREEGKE